jgi:CRISPR/Cas system-associated endonuclease Cas1
LPFRNSRTLKIELSNYGSYLGRDAGCFEVRNRNGKVEHYPHFEKQIGECILKSGSCVSTDALIDLALWNIDTYIMTRRNRVVAVLKNLEDDSHVETRVSQYQALENGKGIEVAKQIVKAKIEGQNRVLKKYGLRPIDSNIGDCEDR